MTLKVGGLFAGYGGIELALASVLDTEPAWFSEFDKAPSAILAHHWPDVPNLGDVTKIDWAAVEPVDIITGGSPCQDLSHAGKRAGMKAGTRSGLWASMCDAIDIIRPRLVVWENVRGALSAEADSAVEPCPICVGDGGRVSLRALGRVLGDLAELGYDANWYGLRAADVGAAHGRWRVFVFATPADAGSIGWGEGAGDWAGPGTAPRGGQAGRTGGHPLLGTDGAPDGLTLLPTPAVNDMGAAYTPETWDAWTERMKAEHGNGNGHGKSLNIEALRLLPTPTTVEGTGPGSHGTVGDNLRTVVDQLLPTPRATAGTKGGPNQRGSSGDLMLPSAAALLPTPRATRGGSATETAALLPTPRAQHGEPRNQNIYHRPADQPQNLENALYHLIGDDDADTTQACASEELRDVRDADGAEAVREAPRGSGCVPAAASLLPVVREHTARGDEGCAALAGSEAQDGSVRGVCHDCGPACASQRPEPCEQRPGEPDHALRELSSAAALEGGPTEEARSGEEGRHNSSQDWREYEAAIRRWEIHLGRPAPDPTELTAKGTHRLSAAFCEWLMGLPEGHVTDPAIGISRNDQLKALGNGVVPQQCAAALRAFLHDTQERAA